MRIYLSNKVSCIKKFGDSLYIKTEKNMYQVSKPVQLLVDLYIDGVTDFEQMLLILINKYKINGSFSDVKDVFENNSQFLDIFTFEECSNSVKVVGAYGKRCRKSHGQHDRPKRKA